MFRGKSNVKSNIALYSAEVTACPDHFSRAPTKNVLSHFIILQTPVFLKTHCVLSHQNNVVDERDVTKCNGANVTHSFCFTLHGTLIYCKCDSVLTCHQKHSLFVSRWKCIWLKVKVKRFAAIHLLLLVLLHKKPHAFCFTCIASMIIATHGK